MFIMFTRIEVFDNWDVRRVDVMPSQAPSCLGVSCRVGQTRKFAGAADVL